MSDDVHVNVSNSKETKESNVRDNVRKRGRPISKPVRKTFRFSKPTARKLEELTFKLAEEGITNSQNGTVEYLIDVGYDSIIMGKLLLGNNKRIDANKMKDALRNFLIDMKANIEKGRITKQDAYHMIAGAVLFIRSFEELTGVRVLEGGGEEAS